MIRGSRLQRTYITLTGSVSRFSTDKAEVSSRFGGLVVAECEDASLQDPEQGIPEHGVRFLDLIEEHYREVILFGRKDFRARRAA